MNQQVFKQSFVGGVVISVAILGVFLFFYFGQGVKSPMLFLLLLLPVAFIVGIQKTKIVIEDDVLRYVKLIGDEEISLKNVAQIVIREIEVITTSNVSHFNLNRKQDSRQNMIPGDQERSTERVVYVIDDAGRTFFSFPASLVTRKNRQRFQDAVTAVNPTIQFSL